MGDGGVMADASSVDKTGHPDPLPEDGITCTPDSMFIVPNENNWIHACTNVLGIQGDYYRYSDGG
jgi:hypothetical protein